MFRDIMNSDDEELDKPAKRPKLAENREAMTKLQV
jgi:hypothetical protein